MHDAYLCLQNHAAGHMYNIGTGLDPAILLWFSFIANHVVVYISSDQSDGATVCIKLRTPQKQERFVWMEINFALHGKE